MSNPDRKVFFIEIAIQTEVSLYLSQSDLLGFEFWIAS